MSGAANEPRGAWGEYQSSIPRRDRTVGTGQTYTQGSANIPDAQPMIGTVGSDRHKNALQMEAEAVEHSHKADTRSVTRGTRSLVRGDRRNNHLRSLRSHRHIPLLQTPHRSKPKSTDNSLAVTSTQP